MADRSPLRPLRRIRTVDPRTLEPVPGEVVTDGSRVFLRRPGGGEDVLLEEDLELYQALSPGRRGGAPRVSHLVIEPTYRCNLACPICFTHAQGPDLPLEALVGELDRHEGLVVSISGGEPTVRDDLPEIIRRVARRNIPLLATNGIRLADRDYVARLREAGLRHVTFSFNGFSKEAQERTNDRQLLPEKLAAIDNLVANDIRFLLSAVILRGANEGEIGAILELAARHPRHVKEVRFRSAMPMGKHTELRPFLASEMLALVCQGARLDRQEVVGALRTYRRLSSALPFLHLMQKSCSFGFYVRRERDAFRVLPSGPPWRAALDLAAIFGPGRRLAEGARRASIWRHPDGVLKLSVRVWPTVETLDLDDHERGCNTRYIAGPKKGLPVCLANLLYDRGRVAREGEPGIER